MTVELRVRRAENLSLAEALERCGPLLHGATTIVYTPAACRFAVLRRDQGDPATLLAPNAHGTPAPLPLEEAFEVRAFNEDAELRWLHESGGRGTAVLLSERPAADLADCLDGEAASVTAIDRIEHAYLLWGEAQNAGSCPPGWSHLCEARVGTVWVPLPLRETERARLAALEYVAAFDDGNAAVAEERLLRLEACAAPTPIREVAP